MHKLINYFYTKKALYILSLSIFGIFYFILYLFHALIDAINYAALLSMSLLILYFVIDLYHFCQKTKQLEYFLNMEKLNPEDLPLPHDKIEKQYQQLLIKVCQQKQQLQRQNETSYHDMIDYFTLWVHQIKTPISALHLLIQSDQINKNDISMQTLKIEQYVEMVLHYLKINRMSSDLRIKHCSLEKIILDVIKKQTTFFINKKIQLKLDPIHLTILTDEKWISFVIEQIISNALKYTKNGSIHIYVHNETLFIEDTGIGIKAEDLPRLFEKGFTGYNGRIDKKASGIGLYLCKHIIDQLGYSIDITSILKQGTCVALDFHVDPLQVE